MKRIIRQIIIVLFLKDKTNAQVRAFGRKTAALAATHSGDYPAMVPPTSDMVTLCDEGDAIAKEKAAVKSTLKTLNVMENDNRDKIAKTLSLWVLIVQGMVGLTTALVTQIGWKIKSQGTDNRDEMNNSTPVVSKANQNTSKKISLGLLNSKTRKKGKPYGVRGFIPFFQIGGMKPTSHETMTMGMPTGAMIFSKTFAAADLGKQIFICFVWYDGNEAIGPDSPMYSFTLI